MTRGGFKSDTGMSPLHYACERRPTREVIEKLIEVYPMAVMTRTMPGGFLPLHIACTWYATLDCIQALLAADGSSRLIIDELGNIPLHTACFSGAPVEVIRNLLLGYPDTVLARNHQGSRPIDIVKRLRHENRRSVMAVLSQQREEIRSQHQRQSSSGAYGDMARYAAELNARYV
jgi:ankyrin repeat protein